MSPNGNENEWMAMKWMNCAYQCTNTALGSSQRRFESLFQQWYHLLVLKEESWGNGKTQKMMRGLLGELLSTLTQTQTQIMGEDNPCSITTDSLYLYTWEVTAMHSCSVTVHTSAMTVHISAAVHTSVSMHTSVAQTQSSECYAHRLAQHYF